MKQIRLVEERENIVEQKSLALLEEAIATQASDLHFIPKGNVYGIYVQKDFQLHPLRRYPSALTERMIAFFKYVSSLDMSDIQRPQSGAFHKEINGQVYSFRVSTIPSYYKESVVIRIQKHNAVLSLRHLAQEDDTLYRQLEKTTTYEEGLVLVNGPTGSGKTTTLYSLLNHCVVHAERHVITLEDPVEHPQQNLLQVQVNERTGLTYATGLRAILRHSPNVIMIGEIRDAETAQTAVRAALSGHLVFSTVHAKDTEGAIYRMMDFRLSKEELRQTIVTLMSQRLHSKGSHRYASFHIVQDQALEQLFERIETS